MSPSLVAHTLAVVAVLVGATTVLLYSFKIRQTWAPAWAVFRGLLQLAAISLVLAGMIVHPALVCLALIIMFTVAVLTSSRRIMWSVQGVLHVALAMSVAIIFCLAVIFGTGAMQFSSRYLLAIGGMLVGNTMSVCTIAGRTTRQLIEERWDSVEGWLALGARPRQATQFICREAVYSSLVPATDQTKTTGLVTLPGAFVGAIFGGASPLEAGRFQIVVLAAIMCAGAIASLIVTFWLGPKLVGRIQPK